MELTREEALRLHRQMWTDMQTELGDNPSFDQINMFKAKWCKEHFPGERIEANCFLCEYCDECEDCPIKWDYDPQHDHCCESGVNHKRSPISEILALPEREVEDETSDS